MGKRKMFILIVFILTVAFIWGHSFMPAKASSAESGAVADIFGGPIRKIYSLLFKKTCSDDTCRSIVRKLAHIFEYAVAGLEIYLLIDRKKILKAFSLAGFIALCDETIQIFSGRGPLISDVWIDIFGSAIGIFAALLALTIYSKIKLSKAGKTKK